jgi:heme-degrading monooxygenase HmoA
MLVRIVRMSFNKEHVDTFLDNFHSNKALIRNFEGCQFLELYRDKNDTNVFFTYSYWNSEADLENYRHSDLFKAVWSKTKPLFNNKPEAWSVHKVVTLK